MRNIILIGVLCGLAGAQVRIPGSAGAAAPGVYAHEYSVTLGNSSQIPAPQTNYPIPVCVNATLGNAATCQSLPGFKAVANGGFVTSASGYDIVPSSTTCGSPTLIPWEVDGTYSGSSGSWVAHIKVSSLAAGGVLYLCVGNSSVTTPQNTGLLAPAFVWGNCGANSYFGVYHLAGADVAADSSGCGSDGTEVNSPTTQAGQIDGGAGFTTGASNFFAMNGNMNIPAAVTLEGWVNQTWSSGQYNDLAAVNYNNSIGIALVPDAAGSANDWQAGDVLCFGHGYSSNQSPRAISSGHGSLTDGTWHHFACTLSAGVAQVYIDGVAVPMRVSAAGAVPTVSSVTGNIGGNNGTSDYGNATMDEVRFAATALSANWIKIDYNSQSAPASFSTITLVF